MMVHLKEKSTDFAVDLSRVRRVETKDRDSVPLPFREKGKWLCASTSAAPVISIPIRLSSDGWRSYFNQDAIVTVPDNSSRLQTLLDALRMRRDFCNGGLACAVVWVSSTCLLLVLSLSTSTTAGMSSILFFFLALHYLLLVNLSSPFAQTQSINKQIEQLRENIFPKLAFRFAQQRISH